MDLYKDGGIGEPVAGIGEVDVPAAGDYAVHGERIGPNEVILVQVFVHDLESEQGQFREVYDHLEGLLPLGVESWRAEEEEEEALSRGRGRERGEGGERERR